MKISGNTDFIGSEDRHLHKSRCGQHKIASFVYSVFDGNSEDEESFA